MHAEQDRTAKVPVRLIAQHGHHPQALRADIRGGLHPDDARRSGEDELHIIIDARNIPLLFLIKAGVRRSLAVVVIGFAPESAEAHHQGIGAAPVLQQRAHIVIPRGEVWLMLRQQGAVQPDLFGILGLVDLQQNRRRQPVADMEDAAVPEIAVGMLINLIHQAGHGDGPVKGGRGLLLRDFRTGDLPVPVQGQRRPALVFLTGCAGTGQKEQDR